MPSNNYYQRFLNSNNLVLEKNYQSDERADWNANCAKVMWEKVGMAYLMSKYRGKCKNPEISWKTIYNNIAKLKEWN